MYISVVSAILGQGLFLGNARLLGYGMVVWLLFHLFVMGYEEPTLSARYGHEYDEFRAAVPRWIPRLIPWDSNSGR
jgi:protein-S-isoprenylcysteine O-methyltransferase Ste14